MNYFKITLLVFCLCAFSKSFATESNEVINQIIFSEGDRSWTSRDLSLNRKVVSAYLKKDKFSDFSDSPTEDFLISRLLQREALLFELKPQEGFSYNPAKLAAGEFSKKEIEDELEKLSYATSLLNLKEKQMSQKARFKAWIDVLKRKYSVKMKSNESVGS